MPYVKALGLIVSEEF